jgi:photosynthetic reaction center cytochrome c subunit
MVVRLLIALFGLAVVPAQTPPPQNPPVQNPTAQTAPQPPRWQPPDPTNLQVLPKTITKPELVNAMRGFTRALGVRCEFCHVGEGNDLSTFDFASDDKRQKRNARVMLRMAGDINAKLADIPEPRPTDTPAVTCFTCHRGQQKPLIAPAAAAALRP